MDAEEFVRAIRVYAAEAALRSVRGDMLGARQVSDPKTLEREAQWFRSLDRTSRARAMAVAGRAVDAAVFGIFCIIDGVRAVENSRDKGDFRIAYAKAGKEKEISNPAHTLLHEIYRAQFPFK